MDTKERHIRENEGPRYQEAQKLKAHGKNQKNNGIARSNRLWLWLGVLILIFILVWWLFSIGTFSDLIGTANG